MSAQVRAYWAVGLMFVIFVGVTMSGALYTQRADERGRQRIEEVQDEQQRDMCDLVHALLSTPRPTAPSSARVAIEHYAERRC